MRLHEVPQHCLSQPSAPEAIIRNRKAIRYEGSSGLEIGDFEEPSEAFSASMDNSSILKGHNATVGFL